MKVDSGNGDSIYLNIFEPLPFTHIKPHLNAVQTSQRAGF